MDLKDYLKIIRRRWLQIIVIAAAVAGVQLLTVMTKEQRYSASAEILFKPSPYEQSLMVPEEYAQQVLPMESKITLLKSDPVMRRACEILEKTYNIKTSPEKIQPSISTAKGSEPNATVVTVVDVVPDNTVAVVRAVIEAYIDHLVDTSLKSVKDAKSFQDSRREKIEADIRTMYDQLRESFRSEFAKQGIWDPESQTAVKINQLIELEKTKQQNQLEVARIQNRIDRLPAEAMESIKNEVVARHLSPYAESSDRPSEPTPLAARRAELQTRIDTLRKKYHERHPSIVELRDEIEGVQEALRREAAVAPVVKHRALKDQIEILRDTGKFIDEILGAEWQTMSAITEQKFAYEERKRKLDDLHGRLLKINDKIEELDLMLKKKPGEYQASIETIREPRAALAVPKAERTTFPIIFLVSLVIGIAGGYIIEYMNDTMRSSIDVKTYINLPTIASIPTLRDEPASILDAALKSPVHEMYNKLSTFIESVMLEQKAKSMLFTSAKAGEGKSTVSSNIAIALARNGEKTVLVDSDLRKPQYHMIFGLDNSRGLSNILSGEFDAERKLNGIVKGKILTYEDYLQETLVENLRVLTSGPVPVNPITLLKSPILKDLIGELKKCADIVIFDSPPILGVVDAALLSTQLDLAFLVMAENNVRRSEAAQMKHSLNQVGANIVGVILNKTGLQPESYYYYYHRYRGYS